MLPKLLLQLRLNLRILRYVHATLERQPAIRQIAACRVRGGMCCRSGGDDLALYYILTLKL